VQTDAFIALGSNLGDRELNLLLAIAELGKLPGSKVTALSSFYETSPVGVTDQPFFLNAVLRLATELDPPDLLSQLQRIEKVVFGRTRTIRWEARKMDLDLLLYNNQVVTSPELVLPHPRLAERRFVLQPLCEIAPQLIHPVLMRSMKKLLDDLRSNESVVKL
jgi:2-amino-4-hydroxy-6-hydroxymethyldihydropteridine diphosphokinase